MRKYMKALTEVLHAPAAPHAEDSDEKADRA
jgi:hypothetical protein